jgi:sodium-dependent dicarboxylate transporter 2/3/5
MDGEVDPGASKWLKAEQAFEEGRRRAGWIVGPLAFALVLLLPLPGITPEAHRLLAILAFTLVFWICETIPIAATALLAPALCIMLQVGPEKSVLAPFGSPIIFLFIGMFFLAEAIQKHGLERRLALGLLSVRPISATPWRLFGALTMMSAFISMWMSNIATTAVMLPIALGVLRACPSLARSAESRARLVLLMAFGASVGGLATPVGTPPNMIALGFLRELAGAEISFVRWMILAVPLALGLMIYLIVLLRPTVKHWGPEDRQHLLEKLDAERVALGPWKAGERNTAVCFLGAIALWLYPGVVELLTGAPRFGADWLQKHFPEEMVGLMAGLLMFILPVDRKMGTFTLTWKEATKIDWGTIMLFAGGLALGKQMFETGLAKWLGHGVSVCLGVGGGGIWLLIALAIVLTVILSETTSNTAAANVMVPMMIAVAHGAGINPIPVALACCLASSFGFLLPVSTAPNAMAYATGEVRLVRMMKFGLLLDIVGAMAIWLAVRLIAPLLGWF